MKPGDQIGPYEILSSLGAGGMGEVWKARDTRLDRIVAIKTLKGQHTARFEQEARAIAALNHPHICQIYDIGPDYLVLEYVEGKPLRGPLPPDQAWTLARQIASALEAAHAKGILHRDLKPGNILVNSSGAKLLDFGLAKLLDDADATQTMGIAGTPLYMSPEQVEGKPLDTRSDIFSFGVVLYELLTGRRPFDSLASVLRDDPAPSGHDVVSKCMAKQPAQRFDSMTRVLAALREIETKPAEQKPSIAVLPFANMSGDKEQEYFSDGLAEEIINALVKIPGLKVIARTSAFAFKGQNTDIRKIAETLGVATILEGSVRRAGNRIRVTAQLITAADGSHLWSERYDRQLEDIFAVQDEISDAIVAAMKLKLVPKSDAAPRHQPSLPAYEAYLRYRNYQWNFTPESLQKSRECLELAIELDPKFALPLVGLADHYLASASVAAISAHEAMPRARELALRALELDPALPEAHAMLGIVAGVYDLNWPEDGRRFALAVSQEPVPWHVRGWYAIFYLLALGRGEEARRQADLVLQENPLDQMMQSAMGLVLESLEEAEQAMVVYQQACNASPQFWWGWCSLGMLHALAGRDDEARKCADRAAGTGLASPYVLALLAGTLMNDGEAARAEEFLATLRAHPYGANSGRTYFHLVRREFDVAVECAQHAVDERLPSFLSLVLRPHERALRQSPAWPALLRELNLTEAQ